jgi:hypothetical protein
MMKLPLTESYKHVYVCLSGSLCLSVSVCLPVFVCACLFACVSAYSMCLSVYLFVYLSVRLCVYMCVCLCVCVSACLFIYVVHACLHVWKSVLRLYVSTYSKYRYCQERDPQIAIAICEVPLYVKLANCDSGLQKKFCVFTFSYCTVSFVATCVPE